MESPSSGPVAAPAGNDPPGRRTFFRWLTYLLGAVAGAVVAVPFLGYLFGSKKKTPPWVRLGAVKTFLPRNPDEQPETRLVTFPNPIRQPWDGMTANTGVFVRFEGPDDNGQPSFLVLGLNCAHLGCPVSWFQQSGLFMCPCHGGVYYANGDHASGPPPRGLFRCVWQIKDGYLEVQAPHYPTLQNPLKPGDTGKA
jgi:Rieske Fe-S protein